MKEYGGGMEIQEQNLKVKITYDMLNTYQEIPFEVPAGVEGMEISFTYEMKPKEGERTFEKNKLDFGVLDQNGRQVGVSPEKRISTYISESYSDWAFRKVAAAEGTWTVVIGVFFLLKQGVEVNIGIKFYMKETRWLKGNPHTHSLHSDGHRTLEELVRMAEKRGLDFMAITDHYTYTYPDALPSTKKVCLIAGNEFTTNRGHMNFYCPTLPYTANYYVQGREGFQKISEEADKNGAIKSICHPSCHFFPWELGFEDFEWHLLEIWNSPMRADNLESFALWDRMLTAGRKVSAIGGSDYHQNYAGVNLITLPTTHVYSPSNTPSDIVDAMVKGKVVVTAQPDSSFPTITCGGFMCGDTVRLDGGKTVKVNVDKLKKGHTLQVIQNSEVIFSYKADKNIADYSVDIPVDKTGYVRAQIKHMYSPLMKVFHKIAMRFLVPKEAKDPIPEFIYAFTNPIYFE